MPKHIAIFDHFFIPTNPAGSCHFRLVQKLCHEYEFTIFTVKSENPCAEKVHCVRIPAPTRPQFLLFAIYYFLAPYYYWVYCLRHRVRFDLVQIVECNFTFADVSYSHFCHRAYLKHHWSHSKSKGFRGWCRWIDHQLRAYLEPWIYRKTQSIVVPSKGLARELQSEYGYTKDKIHIVHNPVDIQRMQSPEDFNRQGFRQELGIEQEDVVLIFVALGQFERKGLPLLLDALTKLTKPHLKLIVVGGEPDLVSVYQTQVNYVGLASQVVFTGMQGDVRPYLWAADVFAFPSFYEVFPLVVLEAAAAGLPLIVTPLNGVQELLRDGVNGILVEPTSEGVSQGIDRFLNMDPDARSTMGTQAQQDVKRYSTENFVAAWSKFYASRF